MHTHVRDSSILSEYIRDVQILCTLPNTSEALNAVIKITGIHDSSLQEIISDIIPGYKQRVTKYARPMLPMYGHIIFATSSLARKPS